MRSQSRAVSVLGWCFGVVGGCAIGCSGGGANPARYVPDPDAAKSALGRALTAWQSGADAGTVASAGPAVEVVDTLRRADRRLVRFEILGEVGGDAGRCFAVRLVHENPDEVAEARFIVVGIDPVWVFREEDYTMISHWDHAMPDDSAAARAGSNEN